MPYRRGAVPEVIFPKRTESCAILLILLITPVMTSLKHVRAKSATGGPLWQKAVAIADANKEWAPGFVVLRIEILDREGKAEQSQEMFLDFESKDRSELPVSPYVDPSSLCIVGNSPFEPEFQHDISARSTGERKNVKGKEYVGYEYVWHREDQVLTGTAWLEQDTGIPVETEFFAEPGIRSGFTPRHRVTVAFSDESSDAWFPLRMITEIQAGLLTLGRIFRITLKYEDYRRIE
ncbi:MAG TPA: hypothetical protein GX529_10270 [Firmicutes bacterium]|nr:hypothetical protein [Candidatus Fermentithermobacillaceae bacterium]